LLMVEGRPSKIQSESSQRRVCEEQCLPSVDCQVRSADEIDV
jgi:hypothetical protein